KQIAIAEELGAMMERKLAGVVGDDAAGVDDDRLHLRALTVTPPPVDVVADRILFGDVGLTPEIRAAVPGRLATRALAVKFGCREHRAGAAHDRGAGSGGRDELPPFHEPGVSSHVDLPSGPLPRLTDRAAGGAQVVEPHLRVFPRQDDAV